MAYWGKKLKHTIKPGIPFAIGDGENTFLPPFNIKKSESTYSRNLSSRDYPALSVRPGVDESFLAITTPNALGQRNNQYPHIQDGTVWKHWDGSAWQNVQIGLANAAGKFVEFNTESKRYTLLFNGTNKYAWDGSSATSLTQAPATKLVTVDDYRIYGLLDSVLKCSAEGSVIDWTAADDADSIAITSMVGVGTAIASFNDTVICWSDQTMHILFGNDPYDFYLADPMQYGCISDRSVIELKGRLYFLDYGFFMVYAGGKPQVVGGQVNKIKTYLDGINTTYKDTCVAGKHGKYIYLSIPYGASATGPNLTLEYDTDLDNWYPHDRIYVDFVNIGEFLYGIDSAGKIWKLNTGADDDGTAISWSWISGVWNDGVISQKKVISDYWAIVDLPIGSTLLMYYSTTVDADDFILLYTFTANSVEQMTRIQIPTTALQNIDWRRIKLAGTGPCTIHALQEDLRIKAR